MSAVAGSLGKLTLVADYKRLAERQCAALRQRPVLEGVAGSRHPLDGAVHLSRLGEQVLHLLGEALKGSRRQRGCAGCPRARQGGRREWCACTQPFRARGEEPAADRASDLDNPPTHVQLETTAFKPSKPSPKAERWIEAQTTAQYRLYERGDMVHLLESCPLA